MRLAVEEISGLIRGHLGVGMVSATSAIDLTAVLAEFAHRHPGLEITLTETDSTRLLDALAARRLDAALVGLSDPPPTGIEAEVVAEVPLAAVVAPTDPLGARQTISLEELARRPLITLPRGTAMRTVIDRAFAGIGVQPRVAFEASEPSVLTRLAGQSLGVAIVAESLARACGDGLHPLAITRPRLLSRLALAWSADGPTSPAARAFIRHARATLADYQDRPSHTSQKN